MPYEGLKTRILRVEMEWRGRILTKSSVRIQATYYETYILLREGTRRHKRETCPTTCIVNVSFNVSTIRVNDVSVNVSVQKKCHLY